MYNGFPVTNTPSIQVWELSVVPTTTGQRSITLTDDCAPIQYFRTGGNATQINVYLPVTPPEGKIIKVINHRYGATNQQVFVYYPDANSVAAVRYFALGVGQAIDFCFSRTAYGFGPSSGYQNTGWMMLQQAGSSSAAYYGTSFSDGSHASGAQSIAMGGTGGLASGTASFIGGGSSNTASSSNSGVFGGSSNNATTSSNSVVVGGNGNTASGLNAVVVGGSSHSNSGTTAVILGGDSSTSGGQASAVLGGSTNSASGAYSAIIGGIRGGTRSISGFKSFPSSNPFTAAVFGACQGGMLVLGTQTTDATATVLTSNAVAATTTNQLILVTNGTYYVRGSCIATVTGGGDTKAWTFDVAIKRGASAAATSIVGAVTKNIVAADTGAAAWDISITADTTLGVLAVTVTGAAATTIRWTCRLDSTEVTY
jgi:hypothetical protein